MDDDVWLVRWVTVRIDPTSPQVHSFIHSTNIYGAPIMHQTHSRHWGFSGNQERHSLSSWSSQPGTGRGTKSQAPFPQKECRRQFPLLHKPV